MKPKTSLAASNGRLAGAGTDPGTLRARLVERVKKRLLAKGLPRFQMSLIVICTGVSGFVVSYLLLHLGLRLLWLRYALAVLLAYGVFLFLVRLWLLIQTRQLGRSLSGSGPDFGSGGFSIGGGSGGSASSSPGFSGGGGEFGGGGASAFFDDAGDAGGESVGAAVSSSSSGSGGSGISGSGISLDLDGDEAVVVIVVVAVAAVFFAAGIYIVVTAPALFAEVLVDGTLSAGLYRHVRGLSEENWLEAALRRTWIPFAVVAFFFVGAAIVFHKVAPEAVSIGGVLNHVFAP